MVRILNQPPSESIAGTSGPQATVWPEWQRVTAETVRHQIRRGEPVRVKGQRHYVHWITCCSTADRAGGSGAQHKQGKHMKHLLISLTAFLFTVPAFGNTVCSNGMIRNQYGFLASASTPFAFQCAVTGIIKFQSATKVALGGTQSCDGTAEPISGNGTYTVTKDCRGTMTLSFPEGLAQYVFTIANGGQTIMFIAVTPGLTLSGTAVRQ